MFEKNKFDEMREISWEIKEKMGSLDDPKEQKIFLEGIKKKLKTIKKDGDLEMLYLILGTSSFAGSIGLILGGGAVGLFPENLELGRVLSLIGLILMIPAAILTTMADKKYKKVPDALNVSDEAKKMIKEINEEIKKCKNKINKKR